MQRGGRGRVYPFWILSYLIIWRKITTNNRFTKFILKNHKLFLIKEHYILHTALKGCQELPVFSSLKKNTVYIEAGHSQQLQKNSTIYHQQWTKIKPTLSAAPSKFHVSLVRPFPPTPCICKELKHYIWWTANIPLHLKCRTPMKQRNVGF